MSRDQVLKPSVYADLYPLVPCILEWLRDRELLSSAKCFQSAAMFMIDPKMNPKIEQTQIKDVLVYLAAEIDKGPLARARKKRGKNIVYPSNNSLNFLLVSKSTNLVVWYVAVLTILKDSNPTCIPKRMVDFNSESNDLQGQREALKKLGEIISDDFEHQSLFAFGEICSIIRDSLSLSGGSEYLKSISNAVGRVLIGGYNNNGGNVMQLCIKHCYSLFTFLPQKNGNWQVKGCRTRLPKPKNHEATDRLIFDKLRRDLTVFYELKDPSLVKSVLLLMNSYSIYELALGILVKYGCLPLGWREFLGKAGKNSDLDWFLPNLAYVSEDVIVTDQKFYIPKRAKIKMEKWKANAKTDELFTVAKEFLQKKFEYVLTLENFLNEYVSEIRFIAESEVFGTQAKEALGIKSDEIESLMGTTLQNVLSVEKRLCADLEVLTLLPCNVKQNCGRAGLLCRILMKHKRRTVEAYSAYGVTYNQFNELFKQLTSAQARVNQTNDDIDLHFVDIYDELKKSNRNLGSSIDVVLQNPVGYPTKTPLYIDRMKKHIEKKLNSNHPSYDTICKASIQYKQLLDEINHNMRDLSQDAGKISNKSKASSRTRAPTNTSNFLGLGVRSPRRRKPKRNNSAVNMQVSTTSFKG